jgi:hypothetical protein
MTSESAGSPFPASRSPQMVAFNLYSKPVIAVMELSHFCSVMACRLSNDMPFRPKPPASLHFCTSDSIILIYYPSSSALFHSIPFLRFREQNRPYSHTYMHIRRPFRHYLSNIPLYRSSISHSSLCSSINSFSPISSHLFLLSATSGPFQLVCLLVLKRVPRLVRNVFI